MQHRTDRIKTLASYSRFRIGALLVQPDRLMVSLHGSGIALEPRMMEVLIALAEHADVFFDRSRNVAAAR